MLTDTHCHLDFEKFDPDRAAVLERARQAGLVRILIPALNLTSSRAVIRLAESDPMLYAAVGIHPNEALTWDNVTTLNALQELAASLNVVAIGEIGLDYYWDAAPHDYQQIVLREQLKLAAELGLPVLLHNREKDDAEGGACTQDLMKILEGWIAGLRRRPEAQAEGSTNGPLAERPGVLHSFSGSEETAKTALALGFYIGITGPITFKNAVERWRLVESLPLDRILIETDAPFLAPVPHRGGRNEPAYVKHIADKIAEIHSRDPQEIAAITTANAARLFSWGGQA